jgi:NCS1 family nucleobase:cation symporter-1
VRHEHYEIEAIFDPHGIYGTVNWRALGPYLLGVAVEVPFMNTSFYTGPVVNSLGGADISWILGLIVSSVAYYLASRPLQIPADAPLPAAPVAGLGNSGTAATSAPAGRSS